MASQPLLSSSSAEELPTVEAVDQFHHHKTLTTPTVGPYYRNVDRAIEDSVLDSFIFPDGHRLPIVEKWFSGGNFPKDIITWPHTSTEWESWVERMMGRYESSWKQWSICEAIAMSTKHIRCDTSLIFTFLSFWNSKINSFVFPWGLMGPTLLDVTMITGLQVHGQELPEFYNWTERREMPPIEKKATQYSTYIKTFQRSSAIPSQTEHKMFLLYWFCRFFACVSGKSIVKAYTQFVDVIMSGESVALGSYFLGLLFNSINQTLQKLSVGTVPATTMSGPWWFLQLWINLYFPQLFGPTADTLLSEVSTIYGLQLVHFPGSAFNEQEIVVYLLSQKPKDKDFYPYNSKNNCSDFPHWMLAVNNNAVLEQLALIWNRILKPQALMIGYDVGDRYNPIRVELYSPQCLARQLGCKQGIPRPLTYLVKLGMLGRPILEVCQIEALSSRQMIISNSYLPFKIDPGRRKGFAAWWEKVRQQIFPDEMAIYRNKFDNVSRRGKRKAPVTQRKRFTKQRIDATSNQSVPEPVHVDSSGSQSPTTSKPIEERVGDDASSDEQVMQVATPLTIVNPATLGTQPLADQEVTSVELTGLLQPHAVEKHVKCRDDGAEQLATVTELAEVTADPVDQSLVDTPKVPQPRSSEIMAVQTLARTIEESLAAVDAVITQARAAAASTPPTRSSRSIGLEAGRSNQVSRRIFLDGLNPILTRKSHPESASSSGNSPLGPSQRLARVSENFPQSQGPLPAQIRTILHFDLDLSVGYLSELQMCLAQLAELESDAPLTPEMKEEVDDLISKVIEINCIYPTIEPFQASSTQQLEMLSKLKVQKRVIESEKVAILASAEEAETKKIPLRQREAELVEIIAKAQAELTAIQKELYQLDEVQVKAVHELAEVEEKMKSLQFQLSTAPVLWKLHSSRQKTGYKIRIKLEAIWKQVQTKWSRLEARIDHLSRAPLKATYCAGANLTFRSLDRNFLY